MLAKWQYPNLWKKMIHSSYLCSCLHVECHTFFAHTMWSMINCFTKLFSSIREIIILEWFAFFLLVPYFLCWYFSTNEEKYIFIKIYLNIFQKSKFMTYEFQAQTFILLKFFSVLRLLSKRTLCNVNYIIIIMYAYYMHSVVYFLGERSKCSQINLPLINFNRFIFPLGVMKCELRSAYIFKNYARRAQIQINKKEFWEFQQQQHY